MDSEKQARLERRERLDRLLADPGLMDTIVDHIANGGTLITLVEVWDVQYGKIINWINDDKDREKRYRKALNARAEWGEERILKELRDLGFVDLAQAYDDKGKLKLPHEMPPEIRRALAGIDVTEEFITVDGKQEVVGTTKKIKTYDKLRAIELLGKTQRMFVDRTETRAIVTLEDLVVESNGGDSESGEAGT